MSIEFTVPPSAPKRGNRMTEAIAHFALRITGWGATGPFPESPKFVAVAAPHRTAILDFGIGMMLMYAIGVRFSFMIKHTVVRWPIGGPIKWLGGIPINRTAAHGVVAQVAKAFHEHEKLIMAIMPEGTRSNAGVPVSQWKRGFYHIAHRSNVPVVPVYLSYTHRRIRFGEVLNTSGDIDADLAILQEFYDYHAARE